MKISYSTDVNDFGGPDDNLNKRVIANTILCHSCSASGETDALCQKVGSLTQWSRILINHTPIHNTYYMQVYPCPAPSGCNLAIGVGITNLCATIRHEIGHVYGLNHTNSLINSTHDAVDDGNPNGTPCDDGATPNDLMNTIQTNPCAPGTLSVNDKCMFIDLYCKGTGILAVRSKTISTNNFIIHPNPRLE